MIPPFRSSAGRATGATALLSAVALLAGCSAVRPRPLAPAEVLASSRAAIDASRLGVQPITGALTLEEATARALKYNLNERTRQLEQALALDVWRGGNFDLLPRALASAGYRARDEELITRSRDSVTGLPSLANPYISSEREAALYDLGLSWSVLDFTVGYYQAKQNADRVLIAAEHRRKALHTLSRDVAVAFWRMASAQRLLADVRATIEAAEHALADAAQAQAEGLRSPVDNLRYQRQLLENVRLLSTIEKDFSTARTTLASLINAPLGSDFTVVEPESAVAGAILDLPVERLEEMALVQNADLLEQVYQERIASTEVRKSLAKLLPNLSLTYNVRHSTDNFLINNSWSEAGLLLSHNLTNLLSAPTQKRLADGGVALARQRRVALQMSLLAQVHIARLELGSSQRQLALADRIWDLDQGIKAHTSNRAEAQTESQLAKIAADTASIVSMLRRYQALTEVNVAASNLQATLGLEIDLASVDELSLPELTRAVGEWRQAWQQGRLAPRVEPALAAAAAAAR